MNEKISPGLVAAMAEPSRAIEKKRIIVKYRPEVGVQARFVAGIAAVQHLQLIPAAAMKASDEQIRRIAADPTVEYIWEDLIVYTCLDVSVPHIQVPKVWAAGFTGTGIPIAIVDTGIDPLHPDFAGRIAGKISFAGPSPDDDNGHGTHVAGIAAGAGAKYRGVAPGASIYAAKVLAADGTGYMSQVIQGLDWAWQQGVKVVNLSLGSPGPSDGTDALSTACNELVNRGIVVCVAAGNFGPGASTIGAPGAAENVITVGATDDNDNLASFSSRGPTSDGRLKPDIVLPGVAIISCRAKGTTMGTPIDANYTQAAGTSMATPHATGIAALLLQAYPTLSPTDIKARLKKAAVDLGLDPNSQGAGRTDAYLAYKDESPPPGPTPPGPGCLIGLLRTLGL
ncbi:MAG: S8 family peptidase [Chloroflexi bacterium]|nr:S8 family peptidase [Chloroflexota bacterium]